MSTEEQLAQVLAELASLRDDLRTTNLLLYQAQLARMIADTTDDSDPASVEAIAKQLTLATNAVGDRMYLTEPDSAGQSWVTSASVRDQSEVQTHRWSGG